MRLIIVITCEVLPDDMFESDLRYNNEKSDFFANFLGDEKLRFSHAVEQNTIINIRLINFWTIINIS